LKAFRHKFVQIAILRFLGSPHPDAAKHSPIHVHIVSNLPSRNNTLQADLSLCPGAEKDFSLEFLSRQPRKKSWTENMTFSTQLFKFVFLDSLFSLWCAWHGRYFASTLI
jgi:hypothetical protein